MVSECSGEKAYDNRLWAMKAFAIFSVVCAHVSETGYAYGEVKYFINVIFSIIGTMGVPIFFIISGFLFRPPKYTFLTFWKNKCKQIVLPWLFCDTLVWLYVVLRKGGISVWAWIKFLIGYNHSTYYLTILFVFFLLFWKTAEKSKVVKCVLFLTGLYYILYSLDFIPEIAVTPYLNPLNWMFYFVLGLFLQNKINDLFVFSQKSLVWSMPLWIVSIIVHIIKKWDYSYWSSYALFNLLISVMVIAGISSFCAVYNNQIIVSLGKMSFTIYLLNHLFAGGTIWITNKFQLGIIMFLRPVLVIALIVMLVWGIRYINRRFAHNFEGLLLLLGSK